MSHSVTKKRENHREVAEYSNTRVYSETGPQSTRNSHLDAAALVHQPASRGGCFLARRGQVLQQAERDGGAKAVLRDQWGNGPSAGLEGVGIPPADGGRVGIRVRRRSRGPRRACLVRGQFGEGNPPCGEEAYEPVRPP